MSHDKRVTCLADALWPYETEQRAKVDVGYIHEQARRSRTPRRPGPDIARVESRCGMPEHVNGQSPEAVPEGKGLLPGVEHVSGQQAGANSLGEVA